MFRFFKNLVLGLAVVAGAVIIPAVAQGPLTPGANLRTKTDANGYLMMTGYAYTAPVTPLTPFSNLRMRTDSNGYLAVTIAGGTINPDVIHMPDGSCTAGSVPYSFSNDTDTGRTRDASGLEKFCSNGVEAQYYGPDYIYIKSASAQLRFGSTMDLYLGYVSSGVLGLNQSSTVGVRLNVGTTDGTLQVLTRSGADGATVKSSSFVASDTLSFGGVSATQLVLNVDGLATFRNNATTGFTRLIFGTNDANGASINKSNANMEARLGNDSAFAGWMSLYERWGSGSPEGVVTAPVGTVYHRTDGGAGTSNYFKESGTGNTGWVAK